MLRETTSIIPGSLQIVVEDKRGNVRAVIDNGDGTCQGNVSGDDAASTINYSTGKLSLLTNLG